MSKTVYTILNFLALSIAIHVAVDLFYKYVRINLKPSAKPQVALLISPDTNETHTPPLNDYRLVIEKSIFGTAPPEEEVPARPEKEAVEVAKLEPTSLKVVLQGTVAGDSQSAIAVVKDPGKKVQSSYRVGDAIQNAIVKKILRGKVILHVDGKDEVLFMERREVSSAGAGPKPLETEPEPGETVVRRSDLAGSLKNINKLLSEVRVRPHFAGGKADGLSLTRIKAGSLFARLGLKDGDVLKGVDDRSIEKPDDILALYKKLKAGSSISLKIGRGGELKTLKYTFR